MHTFLCLMYQAKLMLCCFCHAVWQMMIEDVVCPVEALADMTQQLIDLFEHHGYTGASAVGHALEGNLHLVFAQVRQSLFVSRLLLNVGSRHMPLFMLLDVQVPYIGNACAAGLPVT